MQTDGTNVTKSSQFKSKKIGALTFGSLYVVDSECVLSISDSHIVLINLRLVKVLSYENVTDAKLFNYEPKSRHLTLLATGGGGITVKRFHVMTLLESVLDLGYAFKLKNAVKLVLKHRSLQQSIEQLQPLLNCMFNKK